MQNIQMLDNHYPEIGQYKKPPRSGEYQDKGGKR
jgi:hypothetical protein